MKNFVTTLFMIAIFGSFASFIYYHQNLKEVLEIYTPTKFGIDLNKDRVIDRDEIVCISDIETFSIENTDELYNKYSKSLNLSKTDIIGLGFLAQEFSQKSIENQKARVKLTKTQNSECKIAKIYLNGANYEEIIKHSGFALNQGQPIEKEKYTKNLEKARKLHLVILNHHSNKYHTPDCKFAKLAHDTVIIPQKQLPKNAKPCRYCHNLNKNLKKNFKKHRKQHNYKYKNFNYDIPQIPTPPLITNDGNITLYFTDFTNKLKPDANCNSHVCKEFLKLVDGANSSIDIAIFGYENVPQVTSALQRAKNRGVNIRFVYDEYFNPAQNYYSGNSIIKNISNSSKSDRNEISTSSNMLMHNKFAIFDKKEVYTGSMNFSKNGLSGYDQNDVIVINSSNVANLYELEFEQMLQGHFHKNKTRHEISNIFNNGNSTIEVYFSPQDKSSNRIIQLIQESKHYIYIPAFLITHSKISNELINARKRGVDVRVIIDANNVYTRNTKHQILRNNVIPVKVENYAGKMHAKTMIIDDEYVIMGSMNFSNSGENKNDENMLVIKNPKLAKAYKNMFNYLWAKIPNRYLKYNPRPESKQSIGSCYDGVDNNFNGKIDQQEELCR